MEDIIASLGFPIASVVGLAYYFVQKDKSSREDINKIMDNLREDNKEDKEMWKAELQYSREVNAKLLASNELLAKEISSKLDEILERVGE